VGRLDGSSRVRHSFGNGVLVIGYPYSNLDAKQSQLAAHGGTQRIQIAISERATAIC
jgi:hypothetical protein